MKTTILMLVLITPLFMNAQFGIKAGYNFSNVTDASSFNSSSRAGFHVGVLLAPASTKILSSRTELIFSRQGYNYKTNSNTGNVDLDYIQMGQLVSINITKYFSLLLGAQTAYLISAQADSSNQQSSQETKMMGLFNRVDYGYAVGAEVHPFKGILLGARFNSSLSKLYKDIQTMQRPSYSSKDAKNNVVQVFVGYRFGSNQKNLNNRQ